MTPSLIKTHGLGGARDLPIPPELAIAGAVAALTVSFTVLAVAWRTPRYAAESHGRPAPQWLQRLVAAPAYSAVLKAVGLLLFLYTAMVAVFGKDLDINPLLGIFYIWWWVGLVPLSLLLGPVWKAISPVRTINGLIARATGGDPAEGLYRYPERLGHWPAAVGLYAFVWMELVYPHSTDISAVRLWCAVYVAVMLVGGLLYGDTFYERADPFEVYSSLVARLSVWTRRDGVLLLRSPMANLATVVPRAGLVAVVAVLFGSTAFDSFRESAQWLRFTQNNDWITARDWGATLANNIALLGFVLLVGAIFAVATMLTGVGPGQRRRALPTLFAHSIVPIIVGYIAAHYLSYLWEGGQRTLILASDPFSNGSNWFGTADWEVSYFWAYHPTLLASVKVLGVVLGHVLAAVAAHDRALQLLPRRHQLTGQLPLLVAMVAFTAGGLFLLFAG